MPRMLPRLAFPTALALALAACGPPSTGGGPDVHHNDAMTDHVTVDDTPVVQNDGGPGGPDVVPTDTGSSMSCGGGVGMCNPVTNDGCTGANTCVIVGDGHGGTSTMCAMPGMAAYGAACVSANDCASGFSCLNSVCTRLCCGAGDDDRCNVMGHTNGVCNQPVSFAGVSGMFFACTLTSNCDWFRQDCMGGQNCVPVSMDGTTTCTPAGSAHAGMPCMNPNDCAVGTFCVMPAGATTATCQSICDPTMPDAGAGHSCPSGQDCSPVNNLPRNFGVCVPHMG